MTVESTPELKMEIKKLLLEALKINDVNPEQIDDEKSLFEGENVLQLDSVDALEIVMALQRKYNVHIDNKNPVRFIMQSVKSIADFIANETAGK